MQRCGPQYTEDTHGVHFAYEYAAAGSETELGLDQKLCQVPVAADCLEGIGMSRQLREFVCGNSVGKLQLQSWMNSQCFFHPDHPVKRNIKLIQQLTKTTLTH